MPYGKSYGRIDIKALDFGVPPLGIAYIASFLKEAGCSVKLVDLMFSTDSLNDVGRIIRQESPRWIGLSATTVQIKEAFKVAEIAKKIDPDIKVIIGGIHASALPEETISNSNIDILVYGEGEFTMLELVRGESIDKIKGIFYKRGGSIIKNPARQLAQNIDIFPYPLYQDLPIEKYGNEHVGTVVGLISTRGCPYQCTYCAAHTIHQRSYRKRSVGNIIGEIEKLKLDYKIKRFTFHDDTFTLDNQRTAEICEALIKRNLRLEWDCLTRAGHLTKPLLKIMQDSGCRRIQLGIESGDNAVLRLAKRNETIEDITRAVKWAKEVRMEVIGLFIIGLPYDTKESIRKTIDISKRLKLDYAQFSVLVPLPGSEVWDMAKGKKLLEIVAGGWENFGRYNEANIKLRDVNSKELTQYFNQAYREFYLNPSYIIRRIISIRSPKDLISLLKRAKVLLRLLFG
ncbi:MAG: cobalamin B12-binding domain-containing protein [Candidatus Omnitrophica bacterium]|nr:cobalamin B12-binding domain-containing protein [Candidatus Omnitrophota bacterium]